MTLGVILFAAALAVRGPSGCPPGVDPAKFVCLSIEEAAKIRLERIDLEERLAIAVVKSKRRLNWHLGCGPGVGFTVNSEWDAKAVPIPLMCGVVYGW